MQIEPYSATFARACALVVHQRSGDRTAFRALLTEAAADPIKAGSTIAALIKLVSTVHAERPDDLDSWARETLVRLAQDN